MRARGFEEWLSRNVGKGGERPSYDPFNKAKKGSERNPTAEEYANRNVEEYHHYLERRDTNNAEDEQKRNDSSGSSDKSRSKSSKSVRNSPANLARNLITRVATVVVGGVIVVSGYQAIKESEAQAAPAPIVAEVKWDWSDDYSTVSVGLLDENGNLIREVPATVTIAKTEATCIKDGNVTYTATAEDDGKEYSDVKNTVLPAKGHDFGESKITVSEDGETIMIAECERCHEQVTVDISFDED